MRIGIAGITGRMGRLLIEEAEAAGHRVVGGIARTTHNRPDIPLCTDIAGLAGNADVVIDFTHANLASAHAAVLADTKTPWVLGTSGLTPADDAAVARATAVIPIVYAASFAPGITLLLALAKRLGAALPDSYDAEIIEMHHRQKLDAPSGTALAIGRAVASGRGVTLEEVRTPARDGHTGPRQPGAIGFAALRGGQVIGEHSVLFAGATEHIAISHRAFDRRIYATGAVQAATWLLGRAPGLYGMADVLGL